MKKLATICAILFFGIPAIGLAQVESGLGLGPRLGYYKADNADDGKFFGGLQLRGRFSQSFGIEIAAEYRDGAEYGIEGGQTYETSFVPVTASAMLFLPLNDHFVPYGVAGLGAYYTIYDADGIDDDIDNEFNLGYHLGFGLELPFNESVALNADYRYVFLNPDTNEESLEDTEFSSNAFTVGLMFYF